MILDFCLFGNIRHNFLVPRIIKSAPKTFMPIQIPDLHRVLGLNLDKIYRPKLAKKKFADEAKK